MVGGISAIIGAKILGPRIGKFVKDEKGKVVKVNAFPGHSILLERSVYSYYGSAGMASTALFVLQSKILDQYSHNNNSTSNRNSNMYDIYMD